MQKVVVYPGWNQSLYLKTLYEGMEQVEFASYHGALFTLLKNKKRHKANVLHIHWTSSYFAVDESRPFRFWLRYWISILDLTLLAKFTRVRIVWTVHNLYAHHTLHEKRERRARRLLGKCADSVIVLGESAISLVQKEFDIPEHKITSMAHGNFVSIFEQFPPLSKEEAREACKLPVNKKIYLIPGTVHSYKGAQHAVESFWEIGDDQSLLIIAGKISPEMKTLPDTLPENVVLLNEYIPDLLYYQLHKACDWVILPYERILTSATLITAMGLGCPVITPKMGTLADYLDDQGGILYDPENKHALSEAILSSEKMDTEKMGKWNIEKIKKPDWTEIRSELQELYKALE